jgi:ATP-dependent Lon protease
MTVIPYYGLIMVPGIMYYFQDSYWKEIAGSDTQNTNVGDRVLFLMRKEDAEKEKLTIDDVYPVGMYGTIHEVRSDGMISVHTDERVYLEYLDPTDGGYHVGTARLPEVQDESEAESKERFAKLKQKLIIFAKKFPWGLMAVNHINNWGTIEEAAASCTQYLSLTNEEQYAILETNSVAERHNLIEKAFYETIEMTDVSLEAREEQNKTTDKFLREDAIRKQISILQKQLDEMHPESVSEVRRFEMKIADSGMNEIARKEADKILNRMKQEGENSHEYGSLYEYLDFVTQLCWKKEPFGEFSLQEAEEILDEDHYGLKKPKQRIIQQLAVMALNRKQSGSILLFVGAPGTGKTSLGQSIARALNRKYVRVSLGGIRDEADIRGHRRTYVGAMPGRIMEGMKQAGTSNPVMVLDEVDKLVKGFDGDPSAALLEVLDPEQNSTFTDHYMNVPYDLSDVLFVCTANSTDGIPEPLLNRMEVIEFQGYTETEKMQIAKRHLIPKAMEATGIKKSSLKIPDSALHTIIADYTMEAGVRGLKKRIDSLCRAAAVRIVKQERKSLTVTEKNISRLLDMKPIRHERVGSISQPGVVTGLAWTQAGGDVLFIEALFVPGSGKMILTGKLGDVMKESAQVAISLVRHMVPEKAELFEKNDLHIHVPAGAVPKDGPSAGITLTTALYSLVNDTPVDSTIAMTGEVSLDGRVMPIGGLPEKLMAAVRAGVKTVFIPKENTEDLKDVPEEIRKELTILPVQYATEVLEKTVVPHRDDRNG